MGKGERLPIIVILIVGYIWALFKILVFSTGVLLFLTYHQLQKGINSL